MRPPFLIVLGVAQDAGRPQAGCRRPCCASARRDPKRRRLPACAAVVARGRRWLIDATPALPEQLQALDRAAPGGRLDGVFLTHGHMGHYTGLAHLGREVMGARDVPVHAMPRMERFLRKNAPWEQLVRLRNIALRPLRGFRRLRLAPGLSVTPIPVPHRAEYTETVAFRIEGPRRSALWLPDIDSWDAWDLALEDALASVDAAWIDATFWTDRELKSRDAREVPHPRLRDTLRRLAGLPERERRKVRFVHLNHTNPAHEPRSREARIVDAMGMRIAKEGERFAL